jgi:hypothetical protein
MKNNQQQFLKMALYVHINEEEGISFVEQLTPYDNSFEANSENEKIRMINALVEALSLLIKSENEDWKVIQSVKDQLIKKWAEADPDVEYKKEELGE